jgi:hypothetical protein
MRTSRRSASGPDLHDGVPIPPNPTPCDVRHRSDARHGYRCFVALCQGSRKGRFDGLAAPCGTGHGHARHGPDRPCLPNRKGPFLHPCPGRKAGTRRVLGRRIGLGQVGGEMGGPGGADSQQEWPQRLNPASAPAIPFGRPAGLFRSRDPWPSIPPARPPCTRRGRNMGARRTKADPQLPARVVTARRWCPRGLPLPATGLSCPPMTTPQANSRGPAGAGTYHGRNPPSCNRPARRPMQLLSSDGRAGGA